MDQRTGPTRQGGRRTGALTRRTLLRASAAPPSAALAGDLLAACGGSGSGQTIRMRKTAREVTVRWEPWGTTTMPSDAAPRAFEVFQGRYPNIKMELWLRPRAQGAGAQEEQATAMLGGAGPDGFEHCCARGYNLARQGFFVDLDPLVKRDIPDAIRRDWVSWLIELFRPKDNTKCVADAPEALRALR